MSTDHTQPLPPSPEDAADETVVLPVDPGAPGTTTDPATSGAASADPAAPGAASSDASFAADGTGTPGTGPADDRPGVGPTGYVPSAEAAGAYPPPAWQPPAVPPREVSTSVRSGTIVWGAILVVAGVVLGASAAGFTLDVGLVAIVALAGAGVALLVGALTSSVRRSRRERTR